ncbi:MAG: malate dehydrogenase [Candidatus Dadabacteria bacterium]|nr:malate dehydrogenase [Candidatus Dadabacteria bacterium]
MEKGRAKISVIGAGNVGASAAFRIAQLELADVALIDIVEGVPEGKALDLAQMCPISGCDVNIVGSTNYEETADSDVVIITSGIPRKPGMSRDDLISTNTKVVKSVTEQVVYHSPDAILILVTNPLDAMVQVAHRVSGFSYHRVMGMAGVLDSARFRAFISMELGVSVETVHASVLGGHGDTMVPLLSHTTVAGVPITELVSPDVLEQMVDRTRNGGAEIVKLLKTGSAFYAPAVAAVEMAEAIIKDKRKILPCCVYANGEYGIEDTFVGLPARLGREGVEEIIEFELSEEEMKALYVSAGKVKDLCEIIDGMGIL